MAILECIRCIRNVLEVITKGYLLKYFYSDATSKTQNMSISPADLPHFRHFRLQKKKSIPILIPLLLPQISSSFP